MSTIAHPRILLVDDDDLVLDMYRRLLGRDFEIETARGAQEAIRALQHGPFAVIVSDFRMPGVKGDELLRRVKELAPATSRILMTGALEGPNTSGQDDLWTTVCKPCPYPDLLAVLKREILAYELRCNNNELHHA